MTAPLNNGQDRIDQNGEAFTPTIIIDRMLRHLDDRAWVPNATFLDPACGNGNMLVRVLEHKLERHHHPIGALNSIVGADIMADNIVLARHRLVQVITPHIPTNLIDLAWEIVMRNVFQVVDSLTYDWDNFYTLL
jgi:hypothetical protein